MPKMHQQVSEMNPVTVLMVDDEPLLLSAIQRQFRGRYGLIVAHSAAEALKTIGSGCVPDVIVSDYDMPEMNGVEFLNRVRAALPEVPRIMLTGRADLGVAMNALNEGQIFRFLQKPCSRETLIAAIDAATEVARLRRAEQALQAQLAARNVELELLNRELDLRVQARTDSLRALSRLVTNLNGAASLAEIAGFAVQGAVDLAGAIRAGVWVVEGPSSALFALYGVATAPHQPAESPALARVLAQGQEVQESARDAVRRHCEAWGWGDAELESASLRLIPMYDAERPLAVLALLVEQPSGDSPAAIEGLLQTLVDALRMALVRQRRGDQRDAAQGAVTMALATLAEYRDPETGQHLLRLQQYCRLLAEQLTLHPSYGVQVTEAFIADLVRSSPLHDIGKVGIPDHILLKPGRHTQQETTTMRQHARIGGDTLRAVFEANANQEFLQMAMDIAYHHHERWDGTGYPFGLSGESIPLSARILALADVYDALTTKRVYKPAFPHARAVGLIVAGSGTHFDPVVVAAFQAVEAAFECTAEALADAVDLPEVRVEGE